MKRAIATVLAVGTAGLLALAGRTHSQAAPASGSGQRTPVVVELFTSEGCSSCPPADSVLSRLEKTQPIPGAEVIALGQHVDYWNHGGWADPFSSAQFSQRQNDYAGEFGHDNVYTPQMIVDGKTEFVGSDDDRAVSAIAQAARLPKADVRLTETGGKLSVTVDHLPVAGTADVLLAVTEDGLVSHVQGGENGGRTLAHSAVVRELRAIGAAQPGTTFTTQPTITLASGWHQQNLHVVVFVQERASHRIVGAAQAGLG